MPHTPTSEEYLRPRRDAPVVDQKKKRVETLHKNSRKVSQPSKTLSQPGDARAAGARASKSTLCQRIPAATPAGNPAFTDGKNAQKPLIPLSGCSP